MITNNRENSLPRDKIAPMRKSIYPCKSCLNVCLNKIGSFDFYSFLPLILTSFSAQFLKKALKFQRSILSLANLANAAMPLSVTHIQPLKFTVLSNLQFFPKSNSVYIIYSITRSHLCFAFMLLLMQFSKVPRSIRKRSSTQGMCEVSRS